MEKIIKAKTITVKKSHFHTGKCAEFKLKFQGKRDGKKGIPNIISENSIMSPIVKKEHDKIYSYMSSVTGKVNEYNSEYYKELQSLIAEFSGKAENTLVIHRFLEDKPSEICFYIPKANFNSEFEAYLSNKRKLEKDLDDIGIRKRRFNEYQQKLEKYRTRYYTSRNIVDDVYKNIIINYDIIKKNITLVKPMFWKASAEIDMRLSWYWQGVLLKHKNARNLPQSAPSPDYNMYEQYYNEMISDIDAQIEKVKSKYEEITNLKEL